MAKWEIDKTFFFEYSHRVHVQRLDPEYCATGDNKSSCRHIHGHSGKVKIFIEGDTLDDREMLVDFKEIGWAKDFLDNNIDHKFILDTADPMFVQISGGLIQSDKFVYTGILGARGGGTASNTLPLLDVLIPNTNKVAGQIVDISGIVDSPEKELLEGFFFVNFVPTSERLAEWLWGIVDAKMSKLNVTTSRIEWNETPKSRAVFRG